MRRRVRHGISHIKVPCFPFLPTTIIYTTNHVYIIDIQTDLNVIMKLGRDGFKYGREDGRKNFRVIKEYKKMGICIEMVMEECHSSELYFIL
jgi:hypothetical protein